MLKYEPGSSALHSLGAGVKIALLFALSLLALALPFEFAALFLPGGILLFWLAGIPLRDADWKAIGIAALLVFAVRAAFQPEGFLAFGFIRTTKGVYFGTLNAAYLAGMLLFAEIFVKTTRPSGFAAGLRRLGIPNRIAFSFSIAIQALPLLQEKMKRTRIAQTARGGGKKLLPSVVPLLHGVFQRSKKMAIALESRGFNPDKL